MIYLLGFLTGIVVTGFLLVFALLLRPTIERSVQQLGAKFREKGKILEEDPQEFSDWVAGLKQE